MGSPVISVRGLGKKYRLGETIRHDTLRDKIAHSLKSLFAKKENSEAHPNLPSALPSALCPPPSADFWALKDVSFDVQQGEVVGIIGRNGAGKSTLLKILSQITEPTEGELRLRGRVASLLEVGTGFHPELTGRENIFLNGAILGMTKAEIRKKFDEIVAFSEVEQFLDTPVKRYSSGMYVRLAFAVAAHLEPEILIVDEVLAVGDAAFQKKCLGKMGEVAKGGRTVLFVSHNMAAISNLCTLVLLLARGGIVVAGEADSIVRKYLHNVLPNIINRIPLQSRTDRTGTGKVKLTSCRIVDHHGREVVAAITGGDVEVLLGYETLNGSDVSCVDVGISLHTHSGETLFVLYSSYTGKLLEAKGPRGEFRCRLLHFPLSPGQYTIGSRISVRGEESDWPREGIAFLNVEVGDFYGTGSKGCEGSTSFLVNGYWTSHVTP